MILNETRVDSKTIYEGRILNVHLDRVILPNGETSFREVADHPGGVAVFVLDDLGRVAVVRQYRYVFSRVFAEIPAGKREKNEAPMNTAIRELKEETGLSADRWVSLGEVIPSPGCYGETLYLFGATGLHKGDTCLDEDEFLELDWIPYELLKKQCISGDINDAKTVISVFRGEYLYDEWKKEKTD